MKIGIPGWATGDNSFGTTIAYLHFLQILAGEDGEVHVLTPNDKVHEFLDLIVLPGGKDTSSNRYGKPPSYYNSDPDKFKEYFLDVNVPQYIKIGTPIFGICLGFQQLNVHLGGTLTQNVGHPYSDDRDELVHSLEFTDEFSHLNAKFKVTNKKPFKVNSLHHQGLYLNQTAPDLKAVATAEDGLVEAFIHKTLPIAGVQYHPEEIHDDLSIYLIGKIMDRK